MKLKTRYCSTGDMADTPAAIDRENHILYINPKRYFKLTKFQQKFVKLHEYGHYNLQTDSELEADKYAFDHLAGTEFRSLKQCIECLEELLDENLIGHKIRIDYMYKLATQWDQKHSQLNKASGEEQMTQNEGVADMLLIANTSMIKQTQSIFNSLQNALNSILITGVLVVAMIFILKDVE